MRKHRYLSIVGMCMFLAGCGTTPAPEPSEFTVTWVVDGVKTTETYKEGETPSYKGETPTKEGDNTYSYTFTGWNQELVPVTGDTTYTAIFEQGFVDYEITWVIDGKSEVEKYHYGATPKYKGGTPTKESDAQYDYKFTKWNKRLVSVTENATYKALFSQSVRKYDITWNYGFDKSVVTKVEYGTVPTAPKDITKETEEFSYEFIGWDKEVVAVTCEATYTAVYADAVRKTFTVSYNDGSDVISTEKVEYGSKPNGVAAPEKTGATFKGWKLDGEVYTNENLPTITGNVTLTAYYTVEMTVTSKKISGEVINTETKEIEYNTDYKVEAASVDGYTVDKNYVKGRATASKEITFYYSTLSTWGGTNDVATSLTAVEGEEKHLKITSAAEFYYFANQVNGGNTYSGYTITLESSIQLAYGFPVIGDYADKKSCFSGTFEGNNCSIRGIAIISTTQYSGLFGYTNKATIQNLAIYGNASLVRYGGALVGKAVGGSIKNITSYVSISNDDNTMNGNGGIAGATNGGNVMDNCECYGSIVSKGQKAAGMVGTLEGTGKNTIQNCRNFGKITGFNLVGGMAGEMTGTAVAGKSNTITNCQNYGEIIATGLSGTTGSGTAGGILAVMRENSKYANGTYALTSVTDCTNYGSVTGSIYAATAYVGGVIGLVSARKGTTTGLVNYGKIIANNRAGGISGGSSSAMSDCVNYGEVEAGTREANVSDFGRFVGGIVGVASDGSTYTKCKNYGDISTPKSSIGGIIGVVGTGATVAISECENHGFINSEQNGVGGIAGSTNTAASQLNISNCKNYGDVQGWNKVGGIVGCLWNEKSTCTDCENHGTVTATKSTTGTIYQGDLIGQTNDQYVEEQAS